ncbi:cellulase family glycosylhydrolase [Candidatus Sumerlaeota bacterium]|nr:cellulase family glycosylhydrolase [Candidatus Sumerlaeota bacterium]
MGFDGDTMGGIGRQAKRETASAGAKRFGVRWLDTAFDRRGSTRRTGRLSCGNLSARGRARPSIAQRSRPVEPGRPRAVSSHRTPKTSSSQLAASSLTHFRRIVVFCRGKMNRTVAGIALVLALAAQPASAAWWEKGFDRWHYKDDWQAEFLSGARRYGTTVTIPGEIARAWVEVWAARDYVLSVNGEVVGGDCDPGTIEAYDVTEILHGGRNQIVVSGGPEVIVEGGVVLRNGQVVPIRSDASWGRGIKTSRARTSGPRGYMGDAHQALMLDYTPEQRAKATVARVRSLIGRLLDRDQYRFWRVRDVGEALALSGPDYDLWKDVLDDTTEATTTTALTDRAIARGAWDEVESILNSPRRPIAPHLLDAASDLETRISLLALRNQCKALRLQLSLLAASGPLAEPSWSPRLAQIENDVRQALSPKTPQRLLSYIISQANANLLRLRSEIEQRLGIRLDGLNCSTQNRLGWVISNEPLDNDPRGWEFSFAPPSAEVLDLAGVWRFRLDPKDEGSALGFASADLDDSQWDRIVAPHELGWERLGYDKDNPHFTGKNVKPYNGHAWYRKKVFIPASWAGRDLELDLGARVGSNRYWVYVNGKSVGEDAQREQRPQWLVRIPASLLRAGEANTIAIRVYNSENSGGLLWPRLQLYPVGSRPQRLRTVCQAGIVQAATYHGGARQVAYCGALCPAALVSQTEKQFRIWGWEAKGYSPPDFLAYVGAPAASSVVSDEQTRQSASLHVGSAAEDHLVALKAGFSLDGAAMARNWLLLAPHPSRQTATSQPQALLVVLQRRPREVRWEEDSFGGSALVLDFDTSPGIVGLVRPFGRVVPVNVAADGQARLRPLTDGLCNRWGRMLRNYPVAYAEVCTTHGDNAQVLTGYDFFETDDDWQTEHERLAPLPMLYNLAFESGWPGAGSEISSRLTPGAAFTADPSATYCGQTAARIGDWKVAYSYKRLEPHVRWKGIGTFAEIRDMADRDFQQIRSWGANAVRPQIAFHADWFVKGFFSLENRSMGVPPMLSGMEVSRARRPCYDSGPFSANFWVAQSAMNGSHEKTGRDSGLEGQLLWAPSAVEWLDRIVALHRRHNLTCILNWFWNADYPLKEIGGAPPNSGRYWKQKPSSRQLIMDFWARVAEHYADLPSEAIAYDLLNEPATVTWGEYNQFIKDATAAVRAKDKAHTIFVESANGWADPDDFDRLQSTGDENTVYEFHFYGPHAFDSFSRDIWFPRYHHESETFESAEALEERLLPALRFSVRNRGAQLCHGEMGITFLGPDEAPRQWLETLLALHEKHRIHWLWWNYDGRAIYRTGLVAGTRINPLVTTLSQFMKR